jgi:hypothetical protein
MTTIEIDTTGAPSEVASDLIFRTARLARTVSANGRLALFSIDGCRLDVPGSTPYTVDQITTRDKAGVVAAYFSIRADLMSHSAPCACGEPLERQVECIQLASGNGVLMLSGMCRPCRTLSLVYDATCEAEVLDHLAHHSIVPVERQAHDLVSLPESGRFLDITP